MSQQSFNGLQQFRNAVGVKFQLYNSLFTALPFHRIEKTGILLSLFLSDCEEGYQQRLSPATITNNFFGRHTAYSTPAQQADLLFRFVQYVERQVVLFDALEDAAFAEVNDIGGAGTLKQLVIAVNQEDKKEALAERLKDFAVQLVLTAHPTQFYPGAVLGIINDLAKALARNDAAKVNMYLQQLGKTPFFKQQQPTPYDEAISLVWYLENVFYPAAGRISSFLKNQFPDAMPADNPVLKMGFWPGGDRDGNPFVTAATTLAVADALRGSIIKCYYQEVRRMRRRLTFKGVDTRLAALEKKLYDNIFIPGQRTDITVADILTTLYEIRELLIYQHNGLFLNLADSLLNKVKIFGLHFASLDIRQDSAVHGRVLRTLQQQHTFSLLPPFATTDDAADEALVQETLASIRTIQTIQQHNGVQGCNRYIISQCSSAANVLEVMELFSLAGCGEHTDMVDIVPLFETIDDLRQSAAVMDALYKHAAYSTHLQQRSKRQYIMLGFSDGTKDGGYLMANWSIYKAKEALTAAARTHGVDVVFFDGRGGPPARGGGKTHKFYASMGNNISNKEIQLTVQGQTVSSNFGTVDAAQFNIEQLLHAGISNHLFNNRDTTLQPAEDALLNELAQHSYAKYSSLKSHPDFMDYLSQVSPLRFYAATNIGSRPARRSSNSLSLKDLRAIPYVGAWSQLKQNVTGHFGVGTALQALDKQGRWEEVRQLYHDSLFFKTLLDNCEMAMQKCYFPLTAWLANDERFGELWNIIYSEYELARHYVLRLSGKTTLMSDYPVEQLSIQMREKIVLPLLTIQQFAISRIREMEALQSEEPLKAVYEKLVTRCSFGIINAGRNSA